MKSRLVWGIRFAIAGLLGAGLAVTVAMGAQRGGGAASNCESNNGGTSISVATYTGTPGPDRIQALEQDNVIYGRGGADVICGYSGNDTIYGGGGPDLLYGEADNDHLYGGRGGDGLYGGSGIDRCAGGPPSHRTSGETDRAHSCETVTGVGGG
jgi:Ca2+-binding RTX toxin-like protein